MEINSRFHDAYDFTPSVSLDDTIVYDRKYSYEENGGVDVDLALIIGDKVISVTYLTTSHRYRRFSIAFKGDLIYKPKGRAESWCPVRKCLVTDGFANELYLKAFDQFLHNAESISKYKGEVLLTKHLKEVLASDAYSSIETVSSDNLRASLRLTEPVVLIVRGGRTKLDVFHNLSLSASGLLPLLDRAGWDVLQVAAAIDQYLVTDVHTVDSRDDATRIESAGFDKKISFRHRK